MQFLACIFYRRCAKRGHDLDSRANGIERETTTRQNLFIASNVQIGEARGELDLADVYSNRAIAGLSRLHTFRQIAAIDRHVPANFSPLTDQETGGTPCFAQMCNVQSGRSKNKRQHVEKMYADIRGDAARFCLVTLP